MIDDDQLTEPVDNSRVEFTAEFIVSTWALLQPVASANRKYENKFDLSQYSPDSSLGVEVSSAAIRPCDVEVDAVAAVLVLDGEDLLADVLLVAPGLVGPVDALDRVVADEGLLHQDQLPFVSSVSSPAGHALLPSGVSTLTLLIVGRLDRRAPILALVPSAFSGPRWSAPVVPVVTTRSALPVSLISTDDGIR